MRGLFAYITGVILYIPLMLLLWLWVITHPKKINDVYYCLEAVFKILAGKELDKEIRK